MNGLLHVLMISHFHERQSGNFMTHSGVQELVVMSMAVTTLNTSGQQAVPIQTPGNQATIRPQPIIDYLRKNMSFMSKSYNERKIDRCKLPAATFPDPQLRQRMLDDKDDDCWKFWRHIFIRRSWHSNAISVRLQHPSLCKQKVHNLSSRYQIICKVYSLFYRMK
eukprot:Lithocolla_globosa_v1_NODE_1154_length_2828_cov_50.161197.p2 type:complete len:165 gc:universal NODE_1154_length_2828_cov_50.161197:342-836(+)